MKKDFPITELPSKNSVSIDKLSTFEGLKLMLEDQKKAILAVEKNLPNLKKVVEEICSHLKTYPNGRLIYCGAGTSGRIGVQDGVELYPTFGWPKKRVSFIIAGGTKALTESVENAEDDPKLALIEANYMSFTKSDILICIAASGNTPFSVKVLEAANRKGSLTLAISNNPQGKIQKLASMKILLNTKEEIIAGSTRLKAGTSQKICLNLISSLIMTKLGNVKDGLMINLVPSNKKLKQRKTMINRYLNKIN